jgi:peptidoglycan/xylan/chitin deacetylase (PgdA/CDA1 family)
MLSTRSLKRGALAVFHKAGVLHLVRWMHRKGLRILMYHRFSEPAGLDSQCRNIRENYAPVSLDQVDAWLNSGDPLPMNAIAITVDDGYRDFRDVAYPVLAAWQIPVTVYLVTDFLDGRLWLWTDQVKWAFAHTPLRRFRGELAPGNIRDFSLERPEQRRSAARETCEALKLQPNAVRLSVLSELPGWLKIAMPVSPPPGDEPLAWEDVRKMTGASVTFGAHTQTHPVLSRISGGRELRDEIEGPKLRIEQALERPVHHFCYPNGQPGDITPECVETVRQAGFRTAVTTTTGLIYPDKDRFLLPRIGVEPEYDALYFQRCAAAYWV